MNKQELKEFYIEEGYPTGNQLKKREYREFVKALKREFSFISEMKGRREISVYIHALLNDIFEPPACIICGTPVKAAHSNEFPKTCSKKCSGYHIVNKYKESHGGKSPIETEEVKEKSKKTMKERYGDEHYLNTEKGKKLFKQSMITSTGYENNFQRPECKEKIDETMVSRYGVKRALQSEEIKKKAGSTLLERTGYNNPLKCPETLKRVGDTNEERYGVRNYTQTDEYKERMKDFWGKEVPFHGRRGHIKQDVIDVLRDASQLKPLYEEYGGVELGKVLGVHNTTIYDWMEKHGIERNGGSFLEKSFMKFIDDLGVPYVANDRTVLDGLEIDVLIPSLGIGFEVDGIWWHSSKYVKNDFHKMKTDLAREKGITLYHVFEDEWRERVTQTKRKVANILGKSEESRIYARKTSFGERSPVELRDFFEENHMQGYGRGSYAYVLECDGVVVAAAVFMKDPSNSDRVVLNRYATSCKVVGGLSKIMSNATPLLSEEGFLSIVSYADLRWSTGELYEMTGWSLDNIIRPDYTYVVSNRRIRKQNFRRGILEKRMKDYDPSMTEIENMDAAGIPRIYDCGLARYTLDLNKEA